MEQPVLQVRDLRFSYDGKGQALGGVSLDIRAGERIAVLGPNGAGKSTFFLCLNGVLTPGSGEILLDGKPVGKKERKRLCERVGIVFQNADDQIIASTVAAEVSFGPMNLRLPKEEVVRRVDHALDYMDLQAFRARPPHELSGGEKKRVTIADILAMESEVILFDGFLRLYSETVEACPMKGARSSSRRMTWISLSAGRRARSCSRAGR